MPMAPPRQHHPTPAQTAVVVASRAVKSAAEQAAAEARHEAELALAAETAAAQESLASLPGGKAEVKRREWNRLNARKSRVRKKFMVDAMIRRFEALRAECNAIRVTLHEQGLVGRFREWAAVNAPDFVQQSGLARRSASDIAENAGVSVPPSCVGVVKAAERLEALQRPLTLAGPPPAPSPASEPSAGVTPPQALDRTDFTLMQALARMSRHFIITDPLLEDNPIVFASQGFFRLTGYAPPEVLGHNCRFLQGPDTDPDTVTEIRECVMRGSDCHVVVLNYRKDGSPFWNDLFIAPLRDPTGRVVHFVGVQANVTEERARALLELKRRAKRSDGSAKAILDSELRPMSAAVPTVVPSRIAAAAASRAKALAPPGFE